jgi:hypothetical protein
LTARLQGWRGLARRTSHTSLSLVVLQLCMTPDMMAHMGEAATPGLLQSICWISSALAL